MRPALIANPQLIRGKGLDRRVFGHYWYDDRDLFEPMPVVKRDETAHLRISLPGTSRRHTTPEDRLSRYWRRNRPSRVRVLR